MIRLRREHIIAIGALVAMLMIVGAVYQFYYVKKKAEYDKNLKQMQDIENTLKRMQDTFKGVKPEAFVKAINAQVQPLAEEVVRRAQYFNTGESLQVDPIPEGKMLKFYYADEFGKRLNELRQDAMGRVPYCPYPDTSSFGAPRPEEFENRTLTEQDVRRGLKWLRFGCTIVKMLMDAKAVAIYQVEIWPPRPDFDKMLSMRTVGLQFVMKYADLAAFIESLRVSDRYFNVNAIDIENPYLRWQQEPPLQVWMLISEADFVPPPASARPAPLTAAAAPGATPGLPGPSLTEQRLKEQGFGRGGGRTAPPETGWTKTKRWLRNHYLWPF